MEGAQLSDFYYNRTFMSNVGSKMEMGLSGAYSMVAIDIEHFRLFNKLYGREAGDKTYSLYSELFKRDCRRA